MQNKILRGIHELKKSPQYEKEKIGLHVTTQIWSSFFPRCLFGYICLPGLALCCSSELQGGINCYPKKKKKKKTPLSLATNEPNHSEAKMEIFASELIKQGRARPKQPQTTSTEEWMHALGSSRAVSRRKKERRCMISSH